MIINSTEASEKGRLTLLVIQSFNPQMCFVKTLECIKILPIHKKHFLLNAQFCVADSIQLTIMVQCKLNYKSDIADSLVCPH